MASAVQHDQESTGMGLYDTLLASVVASAGVPPQSQHNSPANLTGSVRILPPGVEARPSVSVTSRRDAPLPGLPQLVQKQEDLEDREKDDVMTSSLRPVLGSARTESHKPHSHLPGAASPPVPARPSVHRAPERIQRSHGASYLPSGAGTPARPSSPRVPFGAHFTPPASMLVRPPSARAQHTRAYCPSSGAGTPALPRNP